MKIVIIGAGGHGKVVLDIFGANRHFEVVGFLDADPGTHRKIIDGVTVLGDLSLIPKLPEMHVHAAIVAIGDNYTRKKYVEKLQKAGIELLCAIHPSAQIAPNVSIGKNVVIAAGTILCTNVTVHDSVILNTGSLVDYNCCIHNCAHVGPGVKVAACVNIEESALIGIGASIVPNVTVGESAIVGAGAVVLQDVSAFSTVVGVPARIVKSSHIDKIESELQISTADIEPARSLITRPIRKRPLPNPTVSQT